MLLLTSTILLLASFGFRGSQQTAAPPRPPSIADSFIGLASQNYSAKADGPYYATIFDGYTQIAASQEKKMTLLNVTTQHNASFSMTILYRFDKGELYTIVWNLKKVSESKCTKTNAPEFWKFFDWVSLTKHTYHSDVLNVDVWSTLEKSTDSEVTVVTLSRDPERPIYTLTQNSTYRNEFIFIDYKAIEPPSEVFEVPSICSKAETSDHLPSNYPFTMMSSTVRLLKDSHDVENAVPDERKFPDELHPHIQETLKKFIL